MIDTGGASIPGVDGERLRGWMDGVGLGRGPIEDAVRIGGGTQNVLVRFRRAGHEFVLRRPPPVKRAGSDETMRREARVLAALASTDVPHPRLIAACPDPAVIGAAFLLMEPVDGFNPTVELPSRYRSDRALQHDLGLAMVDAIASVGRVDHVAVGLADLGRNEGWLERQVPRWRAQLGSYTELDGYPGSELPHVARVGTWLERHRPTDSTPGLLHGDFHFANVLCDRERPRIAAIVDWELATIGDPLLDLGHLLATWPRPSGASRAVLLDLPGLPDRAELIARYDAGSSRDVSVVAWYEVLACYRLGIILEGTYARACAGMAPKATGDRLHTTALALLEQAQSLVVDGA